MVVRKRIRIVLADDHQAVRKCLHKLIIAEPDFVIVGEAADGLEALDLVSKLEPDVLVLDLSMEGMNGLEVTRKLHNMKTKTK